MISTVKQKIKAVAKKLLFPATKPPPARPPKRQQEYAIGIFTGDSPLHWSAPDHVPNPVLTRQDVSDVPAMFVADPFMLSVHGTWYMFFEVWNRQRHKGEIGLATSDDGCHWTYQQIVLTEAFHLSYPYVFEWMHDFGDLRPAKEGRVVIAFKLQAVSVDIRGIPLEKRLQIVAMNGRAAVLSSMLAERLHAYR